MGGAGALWHPASGKSVLLRKSDRIIVEDYKDGTDTATIFFMSDELPLPGSTLPLAPSGLMLKVGIELGWVGFPAVAPTELCFFSGRVSAQRWEQKNYLVDGVAINGVSGGPAFNLLPHGVIHIVGVVSAYAVNRATGEALPGLSVVQSVERFHDDAKELKSIEEAREKAEEQKMSVPPPPQPPGEEPPAESTRTGVPSRRSSRDAHTG